MENPSALIMGDKISIFDASVKFAAWHLLEIRVKPLTDSTILMRPNSFVSIIKGECVVYAIWFLSDKSSKSSSSFFCASIYYTPDGKSSNIVKQKIPAGNYYITFYDQENYANMQKTILGEYFSAMNSKGMSYVHAWHYFRGFGGLKDYSWNGLAGIYCALFSESTEYLNRGFYPNHKAYILQELYGGSGDLMKYSTYASVHNGDKQVGNGLTETFDNGKATDLSGNTVKYKGDIYAYSSNNNGAVSVENGTLIMESTTNAYLGFKVNGLSQGKTYTITFEISQKTSNTAFCIFTSDVAKGSWTASTRIKPFGDKYEVALNSLSVSGNKYSYTITADQDYSSLYFTIRNNGVIKIDSIQISVT